MNKLIRILILGFFLFLVPLQLVSAETLEEQLNHLTGPKRTMYCRAEMG